MAVSQNELDMERTKISPRKKVTEMLRAGVLLLFSVPVLGRKCAQGVLRNCHAKPRGEATRRRRACRCRKARCNITAPRCGKSAGNVVAAPSRKISGDTFTSKNGKPRSLHKAGPATTRKGPWRPGCAGTQKVPMICIYFAEPENLLRHP